MFLKDIYLKNFRGINELFLSFTNGDDKIRKRTVLLGNNGTGKSNILKAIAIVTAGSSAINDLISNVDEWISFDEESCEIQATLITQTKKERKIKIILNRGDQSKNILINNLENLNQIDEALQHSNRNYFIVGYGASRRLNQGADFSRGNEKLFRNDRSQNVATLFNADALLSSLTQWVLDLDYRSDGRNLDIIKKSLNEFMLNYKFHSIDKNSGQIMFSEGKHLLPLSLLSDGYKNILAWIGDLLYRISNTFSDYSSPLHTKGLLLIDEVDLHLHPLWQRRLLEFILQKLPNFQLIATTHSPLTAQQTDEGELFFLGKNKKGETQIEQFKGAANKLLLHQILMSPIFGLSTDESYEVEQLKESFHKMKNRKGNSQKLEQLEHKIDELPRNIRNNMLLGSDHLELLNEIKVELKK